MATAEKETTTRMANRERQQTTQQIGGCSGGSENLAFAAAACKSTPTETVPLLSAAVRSGCNANTTQQPYQWTRQLPP